MRGCVYARRAATSEERPGDCCAQADSQIAAAKAAAEAAKQALIADARREAEEHMRRAVLDADRCLRARGKRACGSTLTSLVADNGWKSWMLQSNLHVPVGD
jgi:hypothetical protein